jgi:hypothetical protein
VDELPVVGKPIDRAVLAHWAHPRTVAKGRSAQGQRAEKGTCHASHTGRGSCGQHHGAHPTENWILDPIVTILTTKRPSLRSNHGQRPTVPVRTPRP